MTTNTYTEFEPCRGYLDINVVRYTDILRFHLNENEMYLKYDGEYNQLYAEWDSEMLIYPFIQGKYQFKKNNTQIDGLQSVRFCYISNNTFQSKNIFYLNSVGNTDERNNVCEYNQSYEAQDVTFYMSDGSNMYFCKFDLNLQCDKLIDGTLINFLTLTGFTNSTGSVDILLN